MPVVGSPTEVPDKQNVTVRSVDSYGTFWSRLRDDAFIYLLLAPFFAVQWLDVLLFEDHFVLAVNPKFLRVEIPSTVYNPPENPIAYTASAEYESYFDSVWLRPLRVIVFVATICVLYVRRERIAVIFCSSESTIDGSKYLISDDDDSLRPVVLFRDT